MNQETAILYSKEIISFIEAKVNDFNKNNPNKKVSMAKSIESFKSADNILGGLVNFYSFLNISKAGLDISKLKVDLINGEISLNKEENLILASTFIKEKELNGEFSISELYLSTPNDSKIERLNYILGESRYNKNKDKYLEV